MQIFFTSAGKCCFFTANSLRFLTMDFLGLGSGLLTGVNLDANSFTEGNVAKLSSDSAAVLVIDSTGTLNTGEDENGCSS